jgi:hypothetical protein
MIAHFLMMPCIDYTIVTVYCIDYTIVGCEIDSQDMHNRYCLLYIDSQSLAVNSTALFVGCQILILQQHSIEQGNISPWWGGNETNLELVLAAASASNSLPSRAQQEKDQL